MVSLVMTEFTPTTLGEQTLTDAWTTGEAVWLTTQHRDGVNTNSKTVTVYGYSVDTVTTIDTYGHVQTWRWSEVVDAY